MDRVELVWERNKLALSGLVRARLSKYRTYWELVHFAAQHGWLDFEIGDRPWLDEESSAVFLRMLEDSRSYLEYGGGGSTVLAAKLNKSFVSVDTDQHFLAAVRRKIGHLAPCQHLVHANIGWTRLCGEPLFKSSNARRRKRWKAYVEIPWRYVENGSLPDLVMVDGRFRVAAALTSCVHLMNFPDSRVVVDDYAARPHYHAIEDHARLVGMAGRMAIFQPPSASSPGIQKAIEHYSLDWR
jgi:hypothetical protein